MANEVKKVRKMATVFSNASHCEVESAVEKIAGKNNGLSFTLQSAITGEGKLVTINVDLKDVFDRAEVLNLGDKLKTKIETKYKRYENVQLVDGIVTFAFKDVEFVHSTKVCVKYQKEVDRVCKIMLGVVKYIEKIIDNKNKRAQVVAERRAAKAAAKRAAAEALKGAAEAK